MSEVACSAPRKWRGVEVRWARWASSIKAVLRRSVGVMTKVEATMPADRPESRDWVTDKEDEEEPKRDFMASKVAKRIASLAKEPCGVVRVGGAVVVVRVGLVTGNGEIRLQVEVGDRTYYYHC